MLIRSQNKKRIININNIDCLIIECTQEAFGIVAYNGISDTKIAEYSTGEKAIKVLDMIQEEYLKCNSFLQNYVDGVGVVENGFVKNSVFQMPADENVEVRCEQ